MKTKNMGITIFIFTCIFRHKVLEYPTNYQQHSQITGLYFHSNLTKVHSIPLHLRNFFVVGDRYGEKKLVVFASVHGTSC